MSPQRTKRCQRRKSRGANLAILAGVGTLLIGFMGVSIYTGVQAVVSNEIQKAASNAAMVGAAAYYTGPAAGGAPTPNPGQASAAATETFNAMVANSSILSGFGAQLQGVNAANDIVSVTAQINVPTAFLAPIGIRQIQIPASGNARALKYNPTQYIGPIVVTPTPGDAKTYSAVLHMAFPVVDGPGAEIVLVQSTPTPYAVEACNDRECYDITTGMIPGSGGQLVSQDGASMIIGSAAIDLTAAGVRKATKLRFSMGNYVDPASVGTTTDPAVTTTNADGSTSTTETTTTSAPDGSQLITETVTTTNPDGSTSTSTTNRLISPDGTVTTSNPDGTTSTTPPPTPPPVTLIDDVSVYGFAGACPSANQCALPGGFSPP